MGGCGPNAEKGEDNLLKGILFIMGHLKKFYVINGKTGVDPSIFSYLHVYNFSVLIFNVGWCAIIGLFFEQSGCC